MSQSTNDKLLERAYEMIEYWQGTVQARKIEFYLYRNDLENLRHAVQEAEAATAQEDFHSAGII